MPKTARVSNVVPLPAARSRVTLDESYAGADPQPRSRLFVAFLAVSLGLHAALFGLSGSWTIRTEPPVLLRPLEVIVVTERAPAIVPQPASPAPHRKAAAPQKKARAQPAPTLETKAVMETPAPAPVVAPPVGVQTQPVAPVVSSSPPAAAASRDQQAGGSAAAAVTTPPSLNADYLSNPPPSYPASARRRGESGLVLLRVKVSAAGKPEEVRVSKSAGVDVLDRAALEAVRNWTFVPARRGNIAVEAWVEVPIQFRLEGR